MVKRTHWERIAGWLATGGIIVLAFSLVDRVLIQPHALWVVQGYHDIIFAAWGLQGTLAGLTLAAVAIVVGRIDERSYGLTVKDLLDTPQYPGHMRAIALSFWDLVIFTLLSCGLNWIAALAGSLVGAAIGFAIGLLGVVCIVHVCVVTLSREETILKQCEEMVKDCLTKEMEHTGEKKDVDPLTAKICKGISEQIQERIASGKTVWNLPEFIFFRKYLHRARTKDPILFQNMNAFLHDWLRVAIRCKQEEAEESIILASMHSNESTRDSDERARKEVLGWLPDFVRYWAMGEVSEKSFEHTLQQILMNLSMNVHRDYSEPAIFLLFFAIMIEKKELYQRVWGAVISRQESSQRKDYSACIAAILCAQRYSKWKRCTDIEDWMDVPGVTDKGEDTKTLRQYIKKVHMSPTSRRCFRDNAQVWTGPMRGYSEQAQFEDMVEWLCFFSVYHKSTQEAILLCKHADKDLPQIKAYLNEKGELKQEQAKSYANFCAWIEGK